MAPCGSWEVPAFSLHVPKKKEKSSSGPNSDEADREEEEELFDPVF